MPNKMPRNVARAIKKYGSASCLGARWRNRECGEGPSYIGMMYGTNVNGANAMINAGQWIYENEVLDKSSTVQ